MRISRRRSHAQTHVAHRFSALLLYACIEAIDGQAAVPILQSNVRLDLMITDVGLRKLDGRQLADFARHHRAALRILFVTGYAEHVTNNENVLGSDIEMVAKPFTLDALAFKIR
jgi:DNA-binding response OmpR family regulator